MATLFSILQIGHVARVLIELESVGRLAGILLLSYIIPVFLQVLPAQQMLGAHDLAAHLDIANLSSRVSHPTLALNS